MTIERCFGSAWCWRQPAQSTCMITNGVTFWILQRSPTILIHSRLYVIASSNIVIIYNDILHTYSLCINLKSNLSLSNYLLKSRLPQGQ